MGPAVSKAQETKFLTHLTRLASEVMPKGLDSDSQRRWTYSFIAGAVKDKVAIMSQEPPPKRYIDTLSQ